MHSPPSRFYLGIDPSLTSTGIAFVASGACAAYVVQPGDLRGGARLKFHVDRLKELIQNRGAILAACIEGPALNAVNRPDDAGQIRGTYLYALAELDIEVYDPIPPTSLKKFATGRGTASKDQMTVAAQREWPGVEFPTDDAVDAAWLAALARALHDDVPVTPSQLAAIRGIRESKPKQVFRRNRRNNI